MLLLMGLLCGGFFLPGLPLAEEAAAPPAPAGVATSLHQPNGWGSIKGRVVLDGPLPAAKPLDVKEPACLNNGQPPVSDVWVVDPQTRGVRWVMVFLKPAGSGTLPIHPALVEPREKQVVLDQPMCMFLPHTLGMRTNQTLLAKNPMSIPHNVVISAFTFSENVQIPPGRQHEFTRLKREVNRPLGLSCGAHPWMKGYLWMFDHPYFAVTNEKGEFEIKDAPAGKWNLVIWHDTGYLGGAEGRDGKPIDIKAGQMTDLGEFKLSAKP